MQKTILPAGIARENAIIWYFFDSRSAISTRKERETDISAHKNRNDRILCRSCHNPITSKSMATDIDGRSSHVRINPAGLSYSFTCYREAPGCAIVGKATGDYSWFQGYQWQIALCGLCGEHIGWYFSGAVPFYGLIGDRLLFEENDLNG